MSTSLKHRWFRVLHHHLLELLQEQLQVLREKKVGEDRAVGGRGGQLLRRGLEVGRKETGSKALNFKDKMPQKERAYWFF